MVNLELFNIVEDIKKVSKAFVVHPRNVNAENAAILPVMLSSKLLPEMEVEDNSKREQLLHSMQNLSVAPQIEKLKVRIDMIGAACESAEKVIADTRKAYFGTRQGPTLLPTIDKAQAAKIQEQENLLRTAVNHGEGLRVPGDQTHITSALPGHLVDVLTVTDGPPSFADSSGTYLKNTPPFSSSNVNSQGALLQASGALRAAASPSGTTSFDTTTASPLPHVNSPRSSANMMNTPSPQQHSLQQQQHQQQQQQQQLQQHQLQQRQKIMQLPQHQQLLLAQQQLRQASMPGLGQISNMSAMMSSQTLLPRMQFGISGGTRNLAAANLSDQMFNMSGNNPGMMPIQQQQQHGTFGNMSQNTQNLQQGMMPLQNTPQTHPSFQQQKPQGQQ
nr:mediator of RNA polymerase II transcription subunit 8-like isoform X6 [Nicotiana tomentosiformis]